MYQLIYSSIALENVKTANIANMLRAASIANKARNITGCILVHKGEFLHFLEGDKNEVEVLFTRIRLDKRHDHIVVLHAQEGRNRCFPQHLIVGDDLAAQKRLTDFSVMTSKEFRVFISSNYPQDLAAKFFVTLFETMFEELG